MGTVHSWLLMAARIDAWVSILKCGTTRCWFSVDKSIMGRGSPVFFGRTQEMPRSGLSLWFPWTAGYPRPAGDPDGCSWCGTRCCDGWVEVVVGNWDPPPPRQCWWPSRSPASFATSLPGKPPHVPRQRRPAAGAWPAPGVLRWWDTLGRFRPPLPALARKDCVSWVIVLCMVDGWLEAPRQSNTDVLFCCVLTVDVFLLAWGDVASLVDFWNVTNDPVILSACRMLHTRCCRTFGSGPRTYDPSNGVICTILRTWVWNPKFCSNASLRSNCRLDAAANPEDMAAICASWMTASFSFSNFDLSSLGDNSEMTDVTMESANDA